MTCNTDFPGFDLSGLFPDSPIWKGYLEFGGYAAEGYQTSFQKFQDLLNAGLVDPSKKLDAAAKAFADNYRDMADRANKWLNDTPTKGPVAEAYAQKIAAEYMDKARALSNDAISAEDRFKQLTATVNDRLEKAGGKDIAGKIGTAFDALQLADAFAKGDTPGFYGNLAQMIGAEVGGLVLAGAVAAGAIALGVTAPAWLLVVAAGVGAAGAAYLGKGLYDDFGKWIAPYAEAFGRAVGDMAGDAASFLCDHINDLFTRGLNWTWPRDPLVLDLDGDGVELTPNATTVLFDHNADGIKTGTQWARADDGMLVRDLNANGTIDSGRELFGDQTQLPSGQLAANGFAALAALDSNADGVFDANDAAYADLKIWRDLNQDGISQANELQSLEQAGVTAINLGANAQGISSFTKTVTSTDGSGNTTTTSTTQTVKNINLGSNNFYREFTDNPVVSESAATLPQMQGAGLVRDMREAMSLGTAQAATLQSTVDAFKAANTTQDRQALTDAVVSAWAQTSAMGDAKARNPITITPGYGNTPGAAIAAFAASQPALYAQLSILERFNGQAVLERYVRASSAAYYNPAQGRWVGYTNYTVSIEGQRLPFFQQAYDALKASTYQSLYVQTEGKALLDQVEFVIDDKGLRLGFDALNTTLASRAQSDLGNAEVRALRCVRVRKARRQWVLRGRIGFSPVGMCEISYRQCGKWVTAPGSGLDANLGARS